MLRKIWQNTLAFSKEYLGIICSVLLFLSVGYYLLQKEATNEFIPTTTSVTLTDLPTGNRGRNEDRHRRTENEQREQSNQRDHSQQRNRSAQHMRSEQDKKSEHEKETKAQLPVHITGAIVKPGVYFIEEGWYLAKLIDRAGGLLPKANTAIINLAEPVQPYEKIHIPFSGEAKGEEEQEPLPISPQTKQKDSLNKPNRIEKRVKESKININQASEVELQSVPGIGRQTAQRIVAYRKRYGYFQKIEDLMQVPGIKEGKIAKIKPYITN